MDERTTTLKTAGKHFRWLSSLVGMFILFLGTGISHAQDYESLLLKDTIFNDTIDHMVFSEWRGDEWWGAYTELTNMGDTAVDLRKFVVRSLPAKTTWAFDGPDATNADQALFFDSLKLSVDEYTLEPGEVFLLAPHFDQLTNDGGIHHRPELLEKADYIGYKLEVNEANDTSSHGAKYFRQWGSQAIGLFVATRVTDTIPPFYKQGWVLVDNVNGDRDPDTDKYGGTWDNVAGFPEATKYAILVRKHWVKEGTRQGGWSTAASDDITTSEWIPIKHDDQNYGGKVFKTVGNHGNFTMDVTGGPGVTVDLDNGTLAVPWGALRGERIIDKEVLLGDGMAWTYRNYSDEGDSLLDINDWSFNQIAMPGDVIKLFACGDELETVELTIQYADHGQGIVKVYPTYKKNALGEWVENYYVTDEEPTMDTIGNVPFATRTDTLIKYLDIAPNSDFGFIFAGDEQRVDLKWGDILKITGADGSTQKQYYIDVLDYEGDPESRLLTMTWPDIFLQFQDYPYYLQNGWASGAQLSDTIPGFSSSKLSYVIKLAKGTMDVPAFTVTPMNLNAKIEVERATDLYGSVEDRTTTITVTSEDGSSVTVYSVMFEVFKDSFQEFAADPFFSTLMTTVNTRNAGLEVVNPGNMDLDLSNYLIVKTDKHNDWARAIQDTMSFDYRYNKYIPGYVYKAKDTTAWNQSKDYTVTKGGINIQSTIGPGDVFVMANLHNKQPKWWISINHTQEIDVLFHPDEALVDPYYPDKSIYSQEELEPTGNAVDQQNHVGYARGHHSFFLFKILNDSILAGTKPIYDTTDFHLIDAIGDPVNSPNYRIGSWDVNGDSARVWEILSGKGNVILVREPDIFEGVSKVGEGINEDHEVCQWIVGDEFYWPEVEGRWTGMTQHFGTHNMSVVAVYVSTITSSVYLVSDGFEGVQDVKGIVDGTTVEQFIDNITRADPEQSLQLIAAADGAELGLSDVILNGDTLIVTAADASGSTKYLLDVTASGLKDNARLTSTVYAIAEAGETGTIEGIVYGTTVKEVLENVEKDADAKLAIIDAYDALVGLNDVTADGTVVLRTASSDVYFEVTAQDKVTKIVYQLVPTVSATDAFVLSDVYEVAEAVVSGITFGISVDAFYNNIIVVGGTSYIETKAGYERSIGTLNYDDFLVVVSDDQSVTVKYQLGFFGMAVNQAPVIDLVESVNANIDVIFTLSAEVTDDGLPEGSTLTYEWTVTSGNADNVAITSPDAASTDVTINTVGNYVLELKASDGILESTASVNVSAAAVGIAPTQIASLQVYPNPATDRVFIEGLRIDSKVTVYDMGGSVIDLFEANDGRHFVDLEDQPAGTYMIMVQEHNGSLRIGKVVKR